MALPGMFRCPQAHILRPAVAAGRIAPKVFFYAPVAEMKAQQIVLTYVDALHLCLKGGCIEGAQPQSLCTNGFHDFLTNLFCGAVIPAPDHVGRTLPRDLSAVVPPAIVLAAARADQFPTERVRHALGIPGWKLCGPRPDAGLNLGKDLARDDALVVILNEVLRQFAFVGPVDLPQVIDAVLLLQEQVALIPVSGAITFKITFEEGILPKVWPEARTRKTRKIKLEEAPVPEHITAGLQAALEQAEAEGQPMAEIAEAAAQGAEITTELNGQELTITAHETENMEAAFNVTGERRKALVEAVKAFIDAPAVYQNAPSFAYVIGDYTVSKTGTVSGPANEALMAALNAKGFIAE